MTGEDSVPGDSHNRATTDNIDPVADSLERLQTYLRWIGEHRASFELYRKDDPKAAELELNYLRDATEQAIAYLDQLTELLLGGLSVDLNKQLPLGFQRTIKRRKK